MASTSGKETCGRCSLSTLVEAVEDTDPNREPYNPFEGGHIEVSERDLKLASAPAVLAGRLKRRIDARMQQLAFGR